MFNEFFYQIEDYLVYCKTKGLSKKAIKSYEQSPRLFARYCQVNSKTYSSNKEYRNKSNILLILKYFVARFHDEYGGRVNENSINYWCYRRFR